MPTLKYQRFTHPRVLKSIEVRRLVLFLDPYRVYFATRGLELPMGTELSAEQFAILSSILASPDTDTPADLLDSIHVINELANNVGMERLFDRIENLAQAFSDDDEPTPGDVAIEAFMRYRDQVELVHHQRAIGLRKTFTSFQARSEKPPVLPSHLGPAIKALGQSIDRWYCGRRCGRGGVIEHCQDDNAVHFMISHGTPMQRQDILVGGLRDNIHFRAMRDDIAIYDKLIGELRINAETATQRDMYRGMIGKYIFGDESLFPAGEKFTLDPLIEYGEVALSVAGIQGLTGADCLAVKMLLPGHRPEELTSRRTGVVEVLEQRMRMLSDAGREAVRLTEAKFQLTFAESRRSRMVTIKPPNVAIYSRDGDADLMEEFLRQRGFTMDKDWQPYAIDGSALARS